LTYTQVVRPPEVGYRHPPPRVTFDTELPIRAFHPHARATLRRLCGLVVVLLASALPAQAEELDGAPKGWMARAQLPYQEGFLERWDARRSYGSWLLVQTLTDVSERLAWELPHADPLMVGDISRRGGGRMPGHKTHDKGVDADVGLYMRGGRQPLGGFLELRPRELDVDATWATIRALLDTGNVQHILLDQDHIERLRSHLVHEVGMDPADVDAIFMKPGTRPDWRLRGVVTHAPKHRSHLHVRITPAPDDTVN